MLGRVSRRALSLVAAAAGLVLLVGLLVQRGTGCAPEAPLDVVLTEEEAVIRYELPPPNSPGTLQGLGPHLWEASFDRRGDKQGIQASRDSVARLVWAELDNYQYLQIDDGALVHDEIRLDRDVYRRTRDGSLYGLFRGMPGDSLILQRSLIAWEQAIAPFAAQLGYERQEDGVVEGRPVRVYRLRLTPRPTLATGAAVSPDTAANLMGIVTTPVSLEGQVYVDAQTGNRLLAELEGRYVPRGVVGGRDPTDEVLVTYRESRSLTGVPVEILPPREAEFVDRRTVAVPGPDGRRQRSAVNPQRPGSPGALDPEEGR